MSDTNKNPIPITVIYNEIHHKENFTSKDMLVTEEGGQEDAEGIAAALAEAGHQTEIFELDEKSIKDLGKLKNRLIFNLADGIGSLPKTEEQVPEILDELGIHYTGANSIAIALTTNKALTKMVFRQNGLPTPNWAVFAVAPDFLPEGLEYPLFVKPASEDCSLGVSAQSIVRDLKSLQEYVTKLLEEYQGPVIVEEYIDGRELNVTVIGNGDQLQVLPISEIVFGNSYDRENKPKIVDFAAKWTEESENFVETNGICPAEIDEDIRKKIEEYALVAYKTTGARDYARVDIRLTKDNKPYLLEVNVNPDLSPDMGASRSAKTYGWDYSKFMSKIATAAAARYHSSL